MSLSIIVTSTVLAMLGAVGGVELVRRGWWGRRRGRDLPTSARLEAPALVAAGICAATFVPLSSLVTTGGADAGTPPLLLLWSVVFVVAVVLGASSWTMRWLERRDTAAAVGEPWVPARIRRTVGWAAATGTVWALLVIGTYEIWHQTCTNPTGCADVTFPLNTITGASLIGLSGWLLHGWSARQGEDRS